MSDKNEDKKDQENEDFNEEWNDDSDDSFGLPEVEFNPVDDSAEEDSSEDESSAEDETEAEKDKQEIEEEETQEIAAEEEPSEEEPAKEEIQFQDDDSFSNESEDDIEYEDTYTQNEEEPEKEEEESNIKGPLIIIIVTILIISGAVLAYFFYFKPIQEVNEKYENAIAIADKSFESKQWTNAVSEYKAASKIKPEEVYPKDQISKANTEKAAEIARKAEEAARLAREEAARKAEMEAKPKPGEVTTLTTPTGKYYVVVASNIDDDLAMDYAKELSMAGANVSLLTPKGDKKYYRVTIAEGDTFAETQNKANELKSNYANAWVVKY